MNTKKIFINLFIIILVFILDRISKINIIDLAGAENYVNIFLTRYLDLYLIWNKGIAFGLFSFDQSSIYNLITFVIAAISLIILITIYRLRDIRSYFLSLILGG